MKRYTFAAYALLVVIGALGARDLFADSENLDVHAAAKDRATQPSLFERFGHPVPHCSNTIDDLAYTWEDEVRIPANKDPLPLASSVRTRVYPLRGDDQHFFEGALSHSTAIALGTERAGASKNKSE